MLLAVDVRNSHIRFGLFSDAGDPDSLERTWTVRTSPSVTSDELAMTARSLLGPAADEVTGLSALSVVPSVTGELRTMAATYWPDVPAVVVAPGVKTGVPLLVDNPRDAGTDRVVGALAAHELFEGAVIVVDLDTATRIDAVSAKGELLGGVFAPGIDASVDAMAERAAGLRKVEIARPAGVLGKNTVAAQQSGIVFGFAGQIDGIVDRLRADVPALADASVVMTGARADLIAPESRTVTDVEPELTLEGLRLVFRRNT